MSGRFQHHHLMQGFFMISLISPFPLFPLLRGWPQAGGVLHRIQQALPSKQSLWKTTISRPQNYSKAIKLNQNPIQNHSSAIV